MTASVKGSESGPYLSVFSGIPPDVMETLMVLVEIELSRHEPKARGVDSVERKTRSPAQIKITGTMKRANGKKVLDGGVGRRNDPLLK